MNHVRRCFLYDLYYGVQKQVDVVVLKHLDETFTVKFRATELTSIDVHLDKHTPYNFKFCRDFNPSTPTQCLSVVLLFTHVRRSLQYSYVVCSGDYLSFLIQSLSPRFIILYCQATINFKFAYIT